MSNGVRWFEWGFHSICPKWKLATAEFNAALVLQHAEVLLPRRNRVSLKYVFDREAGDKKFYIHSGGTQLDIVVREVAAPKLAVQGCRVVKKNVVEVDIVALIGCCHSSLRVKCQSDASFHRLQELVFAALVRLHDNVSRNAIVIYSNVSCCFSTPVKDLMAHLV